MAPSEIVENVRNLFVSHAGQDQAGFRRSAEAIIQEFSVSNRPGEAKVLRDALRSVKTLGEAPSLSPIDRHAQGLISFVQRPVTTPLFFSKQTRMSIDRVIDEYRHSAKLAECGLRPKTRLLFWGPPGCGKTAGAQWLASQMSIPFGFVHLGSLITSFVGETGANLQRVLSVAVNRPMVLLIDEADAIAKSRNDDNDVGELRRVVNSLLQGLDAVALRSSIVILASNHSHLFDPAVWRRFDDVIEFPLPTNIERLAQLKSLTSGLRIRGSLPSASRDLEGFTFAEIERAVEEVSKSHVLAGTEVVAAADIVTQGLSWRKRMRAAASRGKTRR